MLFRRVYDKCALILTSYRRARTLIILSSLISRFILIHIYFFRERFSMLYRSTSFFFIVVVFIVRRPICICVSVFVCICSLFYSNFSSPPRSLPSVFNIFRSLYFIRVFFAIQGICIFYFSPSLSLFLSLFCTLFVQILYILFLHQNQSQLYFSLLSIYFYFSLLIQGYFSRSFFPYDSL